MANTKTELKHRTKPKTMLVSLLPLLLWSVLRTVEGFDTRSHPPCSLRDPLMDPFHEVHHGHDVVWQIPSDHKAVLLFAHEQNGDAFEYFDRGPNCEKCYGMPEQRAVVLEALQRHYAVIVMTADAAHKSIVDVPLLDAVVKQWMAENMLHSLPLVVWGHSAGTFIATALTQILPMKAMVLSCAGGLLEVEAVATPGNFPTTFFAYMPVDESDPAMNHTGKAKMAMAILSSRGVKVAYTEIWPKPLSPLFFTERIRCMSDEMSRAIFAAYEAAGWVDGNGYLTRNPSIEDWQSVLRNAKVLPLCPSGNLCLGAPVRQELTMAFAKHSFTSDANDVIFPWLHSTIHSSPGGAKSIIETTARTGSI